MATLAPIASRRQAVTWRPLIADDLAYVAALERQIHAVPWTLGNFRDALASGYFALVGEREGRIVAFGVLMLAPGEAQVLNVSVVPDQRRSGLGRELLRRLLAVARAGGAEQCFLEVRVSNTAAIALYESEGFRPVARREGYYPATANAPKEDALVLRGALAGDRVDG
jgi:ribosomal-protein-alanine N-acetyltransferase